MRFLIQKFWLLFFCCLLISGNNFSMPNQLSTLLSIVGSQNMFSFQRNNTAPAYLANGAYNQSSVIGAQIANDIARAAYNPTGDGALTVVGGGVVISGNDVNFYATDITVVGTVVINLPEFGRLLVNDKPYDNSIPGLIVVNNLSSSNHVTIQGALVTRVLAVFDTRAIVTRGITTTGNVWIGEFLGNKSGNLIVQSGGIAITGTGGLALLHPGSKLSVSGDVSLAGSGESEGGLFVSPNCSCEISGSVNATHGDVYLREDFITFVIGGDVTLSQGSMFIGTGSGACSVGGLVTVAASTFTNNADSITLGKGLSVSGNILVNAGSLVISDGATTFAAGANVYVADGASLRTPTGLITSTLVGSITGSGAISLGTNLSTSGSVTAGTLTLADGLHAGGGVAAVGTITVNGGTLETGGSGLHVTNGDVIFATGTSCSVAAGGTTIFGVGSIIAADGVGTFYTGAVSINSGNFTLGTGTDAFSISGGTLGVSNGTVTLNRESHIGYDLTAQGLIIGDGAAIEVFHYTTITGGSVLIGSGSSITSGVFSYNGSNNPGTSFSSAGTLGTNGQVDILNTNNGGDAVTTGIIAAGGSLTISGNVATNSGASAVKVSGNISATDMRINSNSAGFNGNAVYSYGSNNIIAGGLLEMNNNSSIAGAGAVSLFGGTVTAASTITMSDNNAGSGSSIGVFIGGVISVTAASTITMNNNIGGEASGSKGVFFYNGPNIRTGGTFTIAVADDISQLFDSSGVTIYRTNGSTPVPFSSFSVMVGSSSYSNYIDIPENRVLLATANQT